MVLAAMIFSTAPRQYPREPEAVPEFSIGPTES